MFNQVNGYWNVEFVLYDEYSLWRDIRSKVRHRIRYRLGSHWLVAADKNMAAYGGYQVA